MKPRIPLLALLAILLASVGAGALGTRADEPNSAASMQSIPYQQRDGIWYRTSANNPAPRSTFDTGGPDSFGYTWNDAAPLNWIDATKGTDTGMSGDTYDLGVGPISLPFSFNYYGNTYNKLYIAASGYLAFEESRWIHQPGGVPSPASPNTLIAPYASLFQLGETTGANRVYYMTGGTAPNRYFVAEWYQVQGTGPDNTYTFEVILHENGDIVFQYQMMDVTYYCGIAGIENATGWTGLNYVPFCQLAPSNRAVRFYHPGPAARGDAWPPYQGALLAAGETATFQTSIQNTGDLGADTYDLNVSLNGPGWQTKLLGPDGTTPLVDTNGNGIVDTGPLAKGTLSTLTVKLTAPASAVVSVNATAQIAVASAAAGAEKARFMVRAAVPAPFAQAVGERWDEDHPDGGAMRLNLVLPAGQATRTLLAQNEGRFGYYASIVETRDGFAQFWIDSELEYTILNRLGDTIRPVTRLTSGSTRLTEPAAAASPDGRVGVVWLEMKRNEQWQWNTNLYFAILSSEGIPEYGPTNLTGNPTYGGWCDEGVTVHRNPRIASTGNNHFVIGWEERTGTESGDCLADVFYTVRDTVGGVVKSRTKLTDAAFGTYGSRVWLTGLTDNRVLASYECPIDDQYGLCFALLSSDGQVIRRQSHMWINGYAYDAVQLSTGEIVLVVDTYDDNERPAVKYSILNNQTLSLIKDPITIDDPASVGGATAASVTANRNGQAIITWENADWGYGAYVHYMLINNAGQVVTPPTIYYTVQPGQPFVGMGLPGYDLTTYRWIPPDGVDGRIRLASALSAGQAGQTASLAIEAGNNGAETATGVTVKLEMDPELEYVGDTSGITPSVNGNLVQWQIPDLPLLERRSFRVNVRLPENAELGTRYPVTISLTAAEADVNLDDNATTADTFVARQVLLPTISRP